MYADVILPLAYGGILTFEIPSRFDCRRIEPGMRTVVQLGKNKIYTGIIRRIHTQRPDCKTIRELLALPDNQAFVTSTQLEFWDWMADYYLCTMGEVLRAAMPSLLLPRSSELTDSDYITHNIREKLITCYALHPDIQNSEQLNQQLDSLRRAPKQYRLLLDMIHDFWDDQPFEKRDHELPRNQLIDRYDLKCSHLLKSLCDKGILQEIQHNSRFYAAWENTLAQLPILSEAQQKATHQIMAGFTAKQPVLLHGVTGSGKTEIYIHLIASELTSGNDVLYMVPEIALTTQLIERLRHYFGDAVTVYHSRFSDNIRVESYRTLCAYDRAPKVIVGARSALFLPMLRPGLLIVDEEHESSYKQSEPTPRYSARDAALYLARISGAKCLLGSATPSIETFYHAQTGKYAYASLPERYGESILPRIIVSDTKVAYQRGDRLAQFNRILLDKISETVANNRQVLLFQNRRGYAPFVQCEQCGNIPECPNCNVTLTWHRTTETLECHYCGYSRAMNLRCERCGGRLHAKGFGTERVEEELASRLPEVRTLRIDTDSAHSVGGIQRLIQTVEQHRTDVVIGTQMVVKGLDFEGITLVGILNADNLLFYPDFRAEERAFQKITQVAGRAGRREQPGEVIIQTSQPDHPTIRMAASGDYLAMYQRQITERQQFDYPPFTRLIEISLRHKDPQILSAAEKTLFKHLHKCFGNRILGGQTTDPERFRQEYTIRMLLKIERTSSASGAKHQLREIIVSLRNDPDIKRCRIILDVDPLS